MNNKLVLIRHGQSEWNLKNLFTGLQNPPLTTQGIKEARQAGKIIKNLNIIFNKAFTSTLKRAQQTTDYLLEEAQKNPINIIKTSALNERDYGDLTGMNKEEAMKKWGEKQIKIWRRSYNIAPPNGESLRDTAARVWLYYIHNIQPEILRGKNILITAHGNSLRALIMLLEGLTPESIIQKEIQTGIPMLYELNTDSSLKTKKILTL